MAIYHLSVKAISRSSGRTATAAAAYRAACEIADERTGEIHDYRRKQGVEFTSVAFPTIDDDGKPIDREWAGNRAALWNAAEKAEKRKDACVAREIVVALPHELDAYGRRDLTIEFAGYLSGFGGAVDVAIHAPNPDGDKKNHHAHLLMTTRKIEADGLGDKLDMEKAGRNRRADLDRIRKAWEDLANKHLERAGRPERIDHRSLEEQGVDRQPTRHQGVTATAMQRKGKAVDRTRQPEVAEVDAVLMNEEATPETADLEAQIADLEAQIAAETTARKAPEATIETPARVELPPKTETPESTSSTPPEAQTTPPRGEALPKAQEASQKAQEAAQRQAEQIDHIKKTGTIPKGITGQELGQIAITLAKSGEQGNLQLAHQIMLLVQDQQKKAQTRPAPAPISKTPPKKQQDFER